MCICILSVTSPCPEMRSLCPLFWHQCGNYTQEMRHGLRQNIFKWAFGLKGTAYSNCSLHTSHHFHSSLSTLLHGGKLFSIFDSYSSRNSANMQFYLFFTDLMNEPQIHRRTFSCDFVIAGASGPFPIFPTSVPVFISASSMSKIEAGHMWKDV